MGRIAASARSAPHVRSEDTTRPLLRKTADRPLAVLKSSSLWRTSPTPPAKSERNWLWTCAVLAGLPSSRPPPQIGFPDVATAHKSAEKVATWLKGAEAAMSMTENVSRPASAMSGSSSSLNETENSSQTSSVTPSIEDQNFEIYAGVVATTSDQILESDVRQDVFRQARPVSRATPLLFRSQRKSRIEADKALAKRQSLPAASPGPAGCNNVLCLRKPFTDHLWTLPKKKVASPADPLPRLWTKPQIIVMQPLVPSAFDSVPASMAVRPAPRQQSDGALAQLSSSALWQKHRPNKTSRTENWLLKSIAPLKLVTQVSTIQSSTTEAEPLIYLSPTTYQSPTFRPPVSISRKSSASSTWSVPSARSGSVSSSRTASVKRETSLKQSLTSADVTKSTIATPDSTTKLPSTKLHQITTFSVQQIGVVQQDNDKPFSQQPAPDEEEIGKLGEEMMGREVWRYSKGSGVESVIENVKAVREEWMFRRWWNAK